MRDSDYGDELVFVIELDRRDILIEAYELRNLLQPLLASGQEVTPEKRKYYAGRFAAVKRRLGLVGSDYMKQHSAVAAFFARADWDNREALGFGLVSVEMNNQEIIEEAYLVRDFLGTLLSSANAELTFEEANCYASCFARVKRWLALVDTTYLKQHSEVVEFFTRDNWGSQE